MISPGKNVLTLHCVLANGWRRNSTGHTKKTKSALTDISNAPYGPDIRLVHSAIWKAIKSGPKIELDMLVKSRKA